MYWRMYVRSHPRLCLAFAARCQSKEITPIREEGKKTMMPSTYTLYAHVFISWPRGRTDWFAKLNGRLVPHARELDGGSEGVRPVPAGGND